MIRTAFFGWLAALALAAMSAQALAGGPAAGVDIDSDAYNNGISLTNDLAQALASLEAAWSAAGIGGGAAGAGSSGPAGAGAVGADAYNAMSHLMQAMALFQEQVAKDAAAGTHITYQGGGFYMGPGGVPD